MLGRIKKYIRNLPYPMIVNRKTHEYCTTFFDTWKEISMHLHDDQSRVEMGLYVLKKTCEFYLAEWCGLLKVDMDIGVWTPEVWYDAETGEMKETLFDEFEFSEGFSNWVEALESSQPIIIKDVESLKDISPMEYQAYCRLEVRSVIGIPIDRKNTGLFVVKNANRFCEDTDFIRMACSLLMLIFDYEIPEMKSLLQPTFPVATNDIRINILGKIEILTTSGVIREDTISQNRTWKILVYLLSKKRAVKALEMVQELWPDEPGEKSMINIRGAIYRFRQRTAGLTEDYLIISQPNGYCLNPKYHIQTDAEIFEDIIIRAREINAGEDKVELLKSAFSLYRGEVFESQESEPWIMMLKTRYSMLYVDLVNMLLEELANQGEEEELREYAMKSIEIEPGNVTAYYHLISSIKRAGGPIQTNLDMAKKHLTEEEYRTLIESLSDNLIER